MRNLYLRLRQNCFVDNIITHEHDNLLKSFGEGEALQNFFKLVIIITLLISGLIFTWI